MIAHCFSGDAHGFSRLPWLGFVHLSYKQSTSWNSNVSSLGNMFSNFGQARSLPLQARQSVAMARKVQIGLLAR